MCHGSILLAVQARCLIFCEQAHILNTHTLLALHKRYQQGYIIYYELFTLHVRENLRAGKLIRFSFEASSIL